MNIFSPDEWYTSVHALFEAVRARRNHLEERPIETGEFRIEATYTDDRVIRETSGRIANMAHWSSANSRPSPARRQLPSDVAR